MVVLKIAKDKIHQGSSGQITGDIYFETSKGYFPFEKWNDFLVNIIQFWSDEFMECVKNNRNSFKFMFMDGPYTIYAKRCGMQTFDMHFLDSQGDSVIVFQEVREEEIADCLIDGYRTIIEGLQDKEICERTIAILIKRLAELESWRAHSRSQKTDR